MQVCLKRTVHSETCRSGIAYYSLFSLYFICFTYHSAIKERQSSVLHGSETWPVRKENEMALQRAEMRMVWWMCGVKLKDRASNKELRERLGIVDITSLLQQNRLRWYGHVLRKDDNDWVKKCMEYEIVGSRPRGRPKKTWLEVVQRDCQVRGLSRDDAMVVVDGGS